MQESRSRYWLNDCAKVRDQAPHTLAIPCLLVIAAILLEIGCRPTAGVCRNLIPAEANSVVPATTPAGTDGCRGDANGIEIRVEARRSGLEWERGRVWVDGDETTLAQFSEALNRARTRRAVRELGNRAHDAVKSAVETTKELLGNVKK